tara:strand:- start:1275 stop:1430 length:156 start_codon:yes stop_codon:yes gene_type:complete
LIEIMAKTRKASVSQEEQLTTSLIGLAAIFVACAIWWSLAPQWLISSWQLF